MPAAVVKPLSGVKVLEFAAIGPVPWGVHLLVQLGASVTRIQRPAGTRPQVAVRALSDIGREDVILDLKSADGVAQAKALIAHADVLIEGFRPGVLERLGLGPEEAFAVNPGLVYARVTGWGQSGPLAERAGHDINYIALSGALHAIGRSNEPPVVPLNLIADYGGGGAFLVIGVLAALIQARERGEGSVLDVAMLDGAANLMAVAYERLGNGQWHDERGANLIDGGAPWYDVYPTKDGRYVAVGAIEAAFYDALLAGLALEPSTVPDRADLDQWPALRQVFRDVFATRTRDEWARVFEGTDACVSPVLSLTEAPYHPHNQARAVFHDEEGVVRPAAVPRWARPTVSAGRAAT